MITEQEKKIIEEYAHFYKPLIRTQVHAMKNANIVINVNPDGLIKVRVEQVVYHYRK